MPYAPPPNAGELLSSWIERIGIFYGIGYLRARVILDPNRDSVGWGESEDVDSSDMIRRLLIAWTGYRDQLVPPLLPKADNRILHVSARLAYCAKCWSDDARNGRAPYIRRHWAYWDSAICAQHQTWLCARRPGDSRGSELNGWAPIWQTNPHWASAAYLRHDPTLSSLTLGFEADSMRQPTCAWQDLITDFASLTREGLVLNMVASAEGYGVRAHISEALETDQPKARVVYSDLKGYRGGKPGWIADRICCLLTAAEICRMLANREPASLTVREVLETHPAAKRLLVECRSKVPCLKVSVGAGVEGIAD